MRVLVTGAAGHLGANLCRRLLELGVEVRAMLRRDTRGVEGLEVEVVRGDVRDPEVMRRASKGVEVVYHLAAFISTSGGRGGQVEDTNVSGAETVARAALAAGVRRLVHTSSVHAFAHFPAMGPLSEDNPRPRRSNEPAYNTSKYRGEEAVRRVISEGLDAVIVNPTGIIGPFDFVPSRMGQTLLALYDRTLPALTGGGFDFVDARDVADGAIAAAERGCRGHNYILSSAWHPIREIGRMAAEATGVPAPRFEVPIGLARVAARVSDVLGALRGREPIFTSEGVEALAVYGPVSHAKASRELGYAPRPVSEAIRGFYEWQATRGRVRPNGVA
jgi:dihydroflavonol-4-reductase